MGFGCSDLEMLRDLQAGARNVTSAQQRAKLYFIVDTGLFPVEVYAKVMLLRVERNDESFRGAAIRVFHQKARYSSAFYSSGNRDALRDTAHATAAQDQDRTTGSRAEHRRQQSA